MDKRDLPPPPSPPPPPPHHPQQYDQQLPPLRTEDYSSMAALFPEEISSSLVGGGGGAGSLDLSFDQKGFMDLLGFQDHCGYISPSPLPSLFDLLGHLQPPPAPPEPIQVPSSVKQQQPATADQSPAPAESSEVVNNPATPNSPSVSCSSNDHNQAAKDNKAMEDDDEGQGGGDGDEEEDKTKML